MNERQKQLMKEGRERKRGGLSRDERLDVVPFLPSGEKRVVAETKGGIVAPESADPPAPDGAATP